MTTPTRLRNDLAELTGFAATDLTVVWRQVQEAAQAETALRDILPGLIDAYGAAAATIAAEWYDDLRVKVGAAGRFSAIPADIRDTGSHALIGWALTKANDMSAFQSLIEGGMQRRITTFGRLTVTSSSLADPRVDGWQRVSRGGCSTGFCDMLAGRGAVYSEATADFAVHDNCHCVAVPAFSGEPRPVKPYTPSTRQATDADRARTREWIAEHL